MSILVYHHTVKACKKYTKKCVTLAEKKQKGAKIERSLRKKVHCLEKSTLSPVVTKNMGYENNDDTDANDGLDDHANPGTEYPATLTCWSSTQNQP